jgi:hypothetical protein
MTTLVRVAFLVPALLMASSVAAEAPLSSTVREASRDEIRFVTLDRMIRSFAAQARQAR